jgi:hypothetical protein
MPSDIEKAESDFDQAHGELVALHDHPAFLEGLEAFAKVAVPIGLDLGLSFAPGGSGVKAILTALESKLPGVLAKLNP